MSTVFLGGTCNNSKWRQELIPMLDIDYFDPVVDDWNEEAQQNEIDAREKSEYCLYVITPKMTGVYSIAEVIDDSNKRPEKTVFCILSNDEDDKFSEEQMKSLLKVAEMVEDNQGTFCKSLHEVATYLNG